MTSKRDVNYQLLSQDNVGNADHTSAHNKSYQGNENPTMAQPTSTSDQRLKKEAECSSTFIPIDHVYKENCSNVTPNSPAPLSDSGATMEANISPKQTNRPSNVSAFLSFFTQTLLTFVCKPPVLKLILAFLYLFTVMLFLSLILVGVHLRLPDPRKFPDPLPDIILDNVKLVSWGLKASEYSISSLSVSAFILAVFHKHTLIVLRRMFCVIGTIFFYRAFCVISTQLAQSNSDLHERCPPLNFTTTGDFLVRALNIMMGGGMSINGGQTCGDYVYSGHTVSLTAFNLFIIYYTPKKRIFIPVKILSCCINLFGMICILIAHEHYTVDVILAFIITLLVFNDYHNVANVPELRKRDRRRIIFFSPVAYFMERDAECRIQNRLRIPMWKLWRDFRRSRMAHGDSVHVLP